MKNIPKKILEDLRKTPIGFLNKFVSRAIGRHVINKSVSQAIGRRVINKFVSQAISRHVINKSMSQSIGRRVMNKNHKFPREISKKKKFPKFQVPICN